MPLPAITPKRRRQRLSSRLLLALLLLCCRPSHALDIVVNVANGVASLSRQQLMAIYTMRQRSWPDGTPITVFILQPNSDQHARFCKDMLKLFPHQLQTNWDRLVYSGAGTGPVIVKSEQILLEKIAATPGGIGYVESANSDTSIKVVTVDQPDRAGAR